KRAALFCRIFLPYSETFIYDELAHHQRWSVDVFCRVRRNAERFPYPSVRTPGGAVRQVAYRLLSYWPSFERSLREGGHRLLHAHFGTSGVYALPYKLRLGLPLVVTFHGYDVGALVGSRRYRPQLWRYWALSRVLFARADVLLCASEELRDIVC